MSIEALVQEHQIDQAIMENERLLRSYELQKKSPNTPALGLVALQEGGLVTEPYCLGLPSPREVLGACCSRVLPTALPCSAQTEH